MPSDISINDVVFQDGEIYDMTAARLNPAYQIAHKIQNETLIDWFKFKGIDNPTVVDLGCGTASDGIALLTARPDLRYIGIDKCIKTLQYARSKMEEARIPIERFNLIEYDLLNFRSGDTLRNLVKEQTGSMVPEAIISAYVLHHFSANEKEHLYEAIFQVLPEGGAFVLTDLFCPLDRSLFDSSLEKEIENLIQGARQIDRTLLREDIRDKLVEAWITHYRTENKPTAVEEDIESLHQAQFQQVDELCHLYQTRSLIAKVRSNLRAPKFHQVLGYLYKELGYIGTSSFDEQESIDRYSRIFDDNVALRKSVYSFFDLSGASFVFSDKRAGKFVMLEQHSETALEKSQDQYPKATGHGQPSRDYDGQPRFSLPIFEFPTDKSVLEKQDWGHKGYNGFVNNIFQIQRDHQGLRAYGEKLTLSYEPEFLKLLPSGFQQKELKYQETYYRDDCFECPSEELIKEIVRWRWLVWIVSNFGDEFKIDDARHSRFHDLYKPPAPQAYSYSEYFSDEFFSALPKFERWLFPEGAIADLDKQKAWDSQDFPSAFETWRQLRKQLDSFPKSSFQDDIAHLVSMYYRLPPGSPELRDKSYQIAKECNQYIIDMGDAKATYLYILQVFHGASHGHPLEALAPACAYFYYISLDGRPKRHVVIGLLRSMQSPLEYYVGDKRKLHSAVVIGLASLNDEQGLTRRHYKLLELRTVLRACTDPLVDRLFIKSLMEAEQNSAAIQARKVLEVSRLGQIGGVFVIGSFDHRITFSSQQSRALMLVRALSEQGLLEKSASIGGDSPKVGIVGGGLSGLTAAAALAILGIEVTVYESQERILEVQRSASHRYIHPRIADWPEANSCRTDAELPLLNWTANSADMVIEHVEKEFETLKKKVKFPPRIIPSHAVEKITSGQGKVILGGSFRRMEIEDRETFSEAFDIVIIAVGFGEDGDIRMQVDDPKGFEFIHQEPYWAPDKLVEPSYAGKRPGSVLIVGSGDGALVDLVRAVFRPIRTRGLVSHGQHQLHKEMIELLANNEDFRSLGEAFKEVDNRMRRDQLLNAGTQIDLMKEYQSVFKKQPQSYANRLRASLETIGERRDSKVYFAPGSRVFTLRSLLFNRVVAFLLIQFGHVTWLKKGRVVRSKYVSEAVKTRVTFSNLQESMDFDLVIPRFGPPKTPIVGGDEGNRDFSVVKIVGEIVGLEGAGRELGGRMADLEVASQLDRSTFRWYTERLKTLEDRTDTDHLARDTK